MLIHCTVLRSLITAEKRNARDISMRNSSAMQCGQNFWTVTVTPVNLWWPVMELYSCYVLFYFSIMNFLTLYISEHLSIYKI
jgi:hypothetical protein